MSNSLQLRGLILILTLELMFLSAKFQSESPYGQQFSGDKSFSEQCTKWAENDHGYYNVKGIPYMCY